MKRYSGFAAKDDLEGKYVFWDIDGTLAPYRFNDHVGCPSEKNAGMSIEEIEQGCFFDREPSRFMIRVLQTCGAKENIILGRCHAEKEIADKRIWLSRYFPDVSSVYLVADDVPKYQIIMDHCRKKDIDIKETVFIDDVLGILREAEKRGIRSFHISSFMDWFIEE